MRKLLTAAALLASVSLAGVAVAQVKPLPPDVPPSMQQAPMTVIDPRLPPSQPVPDARSLASDREVAEARRYYRAQCGQHESVGFCECVTAGVAQALMPAEVRIAARSIGQRITAQGDAAYGSDLSDAPLAQSSAERIARVEGHYADACAQFRS